jgi:hypothetical protein
MLSFMEEDRKYLKYVATRGAIGREGLLVSCWLETWWEMRPLGLCFYLGFFPPPLSKLAEKVSKSFQVHFPTCLGIDLGISFTFSSKQRVSVY